MDDEKQVLDEYMSIDYCLIVNITTLNKFADLKRRSVKILNPKSKDASHKGAVKNLYAFSSELRS